MPAAPSVFNTSSVEVQIDELVLHGIDPRQRHAIGDAVARKLRLLFAREGVGGLSRKESVGFLDAGTFELNPGAPRSIGSRVAELIYRALVR